MAGGDLASASLGERLSSAWERVRSSFGFLSGVAMFLGVVFGFGVPTIDSVLQVDIPAFDFASQDAGRGLLETVATTTVAVAGLAFSVTIVAFTLASSQLSPRVLRTFSADHVSQATLALFLGTFIYCLVVLIRLGAAGEGAAVPNLSITLAILLAIASFGLFAGFIAHIVRMLQPASIIDGIRQAAQGALERPFPAGVGRDPENLASAEKQVHVRMRERPAQPVRARREGYLATFRARALLTAARERDALVVQRVQVGHYVTRGMLLAEVFAEDGGDQLVEAARSTFELDSHRTGVQDPSFTIRQLADIALKGLSPGINDPTTAENAMDALTAALVVMAEATPPSAMRADEDDHVRLLTLAPDLDALVRLGFEQVRVFAAPYPVVSRHLLELLGRIEDAARRSGTPCGEAARQAALIAEGPEGEVPTRADVAGVQAHHARRWSQPGV